MKLSKEEMLKLIKKTMIEMDKKTGLQGAYVPVKFSSATNRKGSYHATIKYTRKNNRRVIEKFEPLYFTFSNCLFDGRYDIEVIKEVIKHEYIHYYCSIKYPTRQVHHGPEFKSACRRYGVNDSTTFKYKVNDDIEDLNIEKKLVYVLTCTNCKKETVRQKKSKVITNCKDYRCAICGGTLEASTDYRIIG